MDYEERIDELKQEIVLIAQPYLERLEVAQENNTASAFTFGFGHANSNQYVLLATREDMFELFGRKWCWHYHADEERFAKFRVHSIKQVSIEEAIFSYTILYGKRKPDDDE